MFDSEQVEEIIKSFKMPNHQAEAFIILRARTLDWIGLGVRARRWMWAQAWNDIIFRIGRANLFDDAYAVNYYELDLVNAEERVIASKLFLLAVKEPGGEQMLAARLIVCRREFRQRDLRRHVV